MAEDESRQDESGGEPADDETTEDKRTGKDRHGGDDRRSRERRSAAGASAGAQAEEATTDETAVNDTGGWDIGAESGERFRSAEHEALFKRIGGLLTANEADRIEELPDLPGYAVTYGGSAFMVLCEEYSRSDKSTGRLTTIASQMVIGPNANPEMMRFLLEQNFQCVYATMSLDDKGNVWIRSAIAGDEPGDEAFRDHLQQTAAMTIYFAEEIQRLWGGRRTVPAE